MDITVTASDVDGQDLRSLHDSLAREPELRGRSRLLGGTPQQGTMGTVAEALTVALEPGGAVAAFAAVIITWLRLRTGSARFRITRPDGSSIEFASARARELDAQAIRQQVVDLTRFLDETSREDEGEGRRQ
ncbi:MAG TPA: hypothetical protein VF070_17625 [Streptosporangiaceae bacterium]